MVKFRTRARTVDMLGRQQIAGVPNAISELFKNAHDAYADYVEVDYFLSDGLFVLRDDGVGMTKTEFEERWLTIGTESKLGAEKGMKPPPKDPNKPLRPVSGEKGIGRLAIAAIGPQVLVLTRAGRGHEVHDLVAAFIHWGLFELPGVNLDEIDIPVMSFTGGTLPSQEDIKGMIEQVRLNVDQLAIKLGPSALQAVTDSLALFDFDVSSMERYLANLNPRLSLEGDGRGVHFYILPATETIAEDILRDEEEKNDISKLRSLLLGFSDTMMLNGGAGIATAFRYWRDNHSRDLLEAGEFWTPNDLERVDHRFMGSFDEYGRFKGVVRIYDQEPVEYVLPWSASGGMPTSCGPFSIDIGHIHGTQRESHLPPDEWTDLYRKLTRIGGVYLYRDSIRMLPYGDVDFDWLEIEKRRTLGAGYYFFSYRRIVGAIRISREENAGLQEKAGREGFRENKAYRELKAILMDFLVQLAAEFFRKGAPQEELYRRRQMELDRRERARREAEKRSNEARRDFERNLDRAFARLNDGEPEKRVSALMESAKHRLENVAQQGGRDLFGNDLILDTEVTIRQELNEARRSLHLERPEGIALTQDLERNWLVYSQELERLEQETFVPAEDWIQEVVSEAAHSAHIELMRRERIERLLDDTIRSSIALIEEEKKSTEAELQNTRQRVLELISKSVKDVHLAADHAKKEVSRLNFDQLSSEETNTRQLDWQREIETRARTGKEVLEHARAQLREVDWIELDGHLVGTAEMRAALEEEVLALRDQIDAYLELSQLGMAVEIINHEFNMTIREIRARIQDLGAWARSNPKLQPLYQEIRQNFEHLDSYLNLFTPLYRRLYRQETEITGQAIANFLVDLFEERFRRHGISLIASPDFKKVVITGYPSTFYPVFINLVDNAIFWLKSKSDDREIHLDADKQTLVVWDNGPGIPIRDRDAVFEMGFSRKPSGRGLGLFVARQVLQRDGYQLELDRAVDGRGAAFRITRKSKHLNDR